MNAVHARIRWLALIVILLAAQLPGAARAQAGPIASGIASDIRPVTDGQFAVWASPARSLPERPTFEIHAINLATGVRSVVASQVRAGALAIDGGIVVWSAASGPLHAPIITIQGTDLRSGREFTVASGHDIQRSALAIGGPWVTWGAEQRTRLLARNIATMAEPVALASSFMAPGGASAEPWAIVALVMDGARVVWLEHSGAGGPRWGLRTVQIGDPAVTDLAGGAIHASFDVQRDLLVYRPAADPVLTALNLRTGATAQIATASAGGAVTTDGRYIFWQETTCPAGDKNSCTTQPGQGTGYDLASASRFDLGSANMLITPLLLRNGTLLWIQDAGSLDLHSSPLAATLPTAPRPAPDSPAPAEPYFPQTGHGLAGPFAAYWAQHGQLPIFGLPLSEPHSARNSDTGQIHQVQYLERQRFEHHPQHSGTPYAILLGRLGVEMLQAQGRNWRDFPPADPGAPHYMAATGQAIAPEFWGYWSSHGLELGDAGVAFRESLALFGYPISGPLMERNSSGDLVLTQWFERARFEHHPRNPPGQQILLGRLAAEQLIIRGWTTP